MDFYAFKERGARSGMSKKEHLDELEVLHMMQDTAELVRHRQGDILSRLLAASKGAGITNQAVSNVEFWRWLGRNYPKDFGNAMAAKGAALGKTGWSRTILQGKGYEWDWMESQRNSLSKVFSKYFAGDCPTQPGIDVVETSLLSGRELGTYQNKAYLSSNVPDLSNTPKDAVVVTNQEKAAYAKGQGYEVQEFMDGEEILQQRETRMEQAVKGRADGRYNFRNVGTAMVKAGAVGCAIGVTMETIVSYKQWEDAEITDDEYLEKIVMAGGDAGVTSAATAGIMVPVSSMITAAGMSNIITIPIAMVVSAGVNKIVAPCFKRGAYAEYLGKARYYQDMENLYWDFMDAVEDAAEHYERYLQEIRRQNVRYGMLRQLDNEVTGELEELYKKI